MQPGSGRIRGVRNGRTGAAALLALVVVLAVGCGHAVAPATRPIRTVGWAAGQPRRAERLFVLLPGRRSPPEDFRENRVEEAIARLAGPAEIVAVDAHLGYYLSRKFVETMAEDLLVPARRAGFGEIWIVGVSLGGGGALAILRKRPDLVDGAILLAPFLGGDAVIERVRKYGAAIGLAPPPLEPNDMFFEEIWEWIERPEPPRAPILLAFGRGDRLAPSHRLLATLLPPGRVVEVEGGHDWRAWRTGAEELLRRGLPPR